MLYAGNIGLAQRMGFNFGLAKEIKDQPLLFGLLEKEFAKKYLKSQIEKNHQSNKY